MPESHEVPEALLSRIRLLLAKAESTDSPAEAEALTERAGTLMAKYGIDAAMAALKEPERDKITDTWVLCLPPFPTRKATLLGAVARPLRVQAIQWPRTDNRVRVQLIGYESDIRRVEVLYTSVLLQAAHLMQFAPIRPQHKSADRQSWLLGFAAAIGQRLAAAEASAADTAQQANTSGTSVALVLMSRQDLVDARVKEMYSDLRTLKTSSSGRARAAGYRSGQSAVLDTSKSVQNRRSAITR